MSDKLAYSMIYFCQVGKRGSLGDPRWNSGVTNELSGMDTEQRGRQQSQSSLDSSKDRVITSLRCRGVSSPTNVKAPRTLHDAQTSDDQSSRMYTLKEKKLAD